MNSQSLFSQSMSGDGMTELEESYFLDYPNLVELDLSNNNLMSLPLTISQCILLDRIDLRGNPMSRPPLVLFSLPKLRAHPKHIKFGDNQECTEELAQSIINDCITLNHCITTFVAGDGTRKTVSFTPDTTVSTFISIEHPEIAKLHEYFFLTRTYSSRKLYISIDDTPLALYLIPGAEFSFDIKYLPSYIPRTFGYALENYVKQQAHDFQDENLAQLAKDIQILRSSTDENFIDLYNRLNDSQYLTSRFFNVKTIEGTSIQISASNDSISVKLSPNSYRVFQPRSISFDYVQQSCLLVCADKALSIKPQSVNDIIPLFAISSPLYIKPKKPKLINFSRYQAEAEMIYLKNKNPNWIVHLGNNPKEIDERLDSLRQYKGKYICFKPVNPEQVKPIIKRAVTLASHRK